MQALKRQHSTFVLVSLLLVGTIGCRQLPKTHGSDVEVLTSDGLTALNPNDVVVAPVIVLQEGADVPAESLRKAFQEGLVRRRYSPLALDVVDSGVVEASYQPGILNEDAILEIVVYSWDAKMWEARNSIDLDLEARILDARSPERILWAARTTRRYDVRGNVSAATAEGLRYGRMCEAIARDIVTTMPARVVEPGAY